MIEQVIFGKKKQQQQKQKIKAFDIQCTRVLTVSRSSIILEA